MANPIQDAMTQFRQLVCAAAEQALADGQIAQPIPPSFTVEIPADSAHGDLAANVAMVSARTLKMPPREIAQALLQYLQPAGSIFSRFEVAGPGFLNAYLDKRYFGSVVQAVLTEQQAYGRSNYGQNQKVMVEFVSANPTGPMHIGNARGGAIGDCLASVLDWAGFDVTREFYINDAGNQIEKFGVSLSTRYLQLFLGEQAAPMPENAYQGADIIEHAKRFAELYGDQYVSASEEERKKALVDYALPLNIAQLKTDLFKYRISYDVWFRESSLYQQEAVQKVVDQLTQNGYTYQKEGAVWYQNIKVQTQRLLAQGKTQQEIDKLELKDDVLIRANGYPTYFAADIAYHYNKFVVRHFDRVINIWGADHHGHVARLQGAMDAIGLDGSKLDIVLMQMVRLIRDGQPVKVSKRTGKSITLVNLLDEIPIDAARFFFNLREANSHLEFDLDLAVEQSAKNPVYYVQYAHARICSILANLQQEGFTPDPAWQDYSALEAPEEFDVIRHLAKLPNEIIEAANQYDPARITRYVLDLATSFHKFYNACKVKGSGDDGLTQTRLNLCAAVNTVLENALSILKIDAPESM